MNIGLDARPLIKYKTGIGYYLDNLLHSILENDKNNKYYLFSDREIIFENRGYSNLFFVKDNKNKLIKKTAWYMLKLPKILKKYEIDVFWGTQHIIPGNMGNIKTVLTIHDLVYLEMPKTMNTYNKIINKLLIPSSIKTANNIIAVSNSTKNSIIKYFGDGINEGNIKVIYEDITVKQFTNEQQSEFFQGNNNIKPNEYLLFIATLEPRKNISTLLKAYSKIREKTNLKLVICGKVGWKAEEILESINNHQYACDIKYMNYISDVEKSILLSNSFMFVFPSLYEGFGLPVIEAIKFNSVVMVANNSSLDELIENAELKFDTLDYAQLSNKIINLYNDKGLYNDQKEYCIKRAKDFDWSKFSNEYIKIFNDTWKEV